MSGGVSLTDARRMWKLLNEAGTTGCHSHELRKLGVSGNPSQRAKDIVSKGQRVFTARESRGKRPGSRYWLQEHAPDFSVPVAPNFADEGQQPDTTCLTDAVHGVGVARVEVLSPRQDEKRGWCGESPRETATPSGSKARVRFPAPGPSSAEPYRHVPPNGADLGSGAPTHRPSAADVSAEPYVLRRDYNDEGDRLGWREMAA